MPNMILNAQRIYPGAEGYGSESRGAYEGSDSPSILIVNTLEAGVVSTGPNSGSFEWCITRNYPRIVLFQVSGTIDYRGVKQEVNITYPYCNIYGQTSDITIIGCDLAVSRNAHDILIQHIKLRPGDENHYGDVRTRDALSIYGHHVMVDHCTFSWCTDEMIAMAQGSHHITISNCLLSHPLEYNSSGGADGFGPIIQADSCVTYIKNLLAYSRDRSPRVETENFVYINNYSLVHAFFPGPRIYPSLHTDLLHHVYVNSVSDYVGSTIYTAFAKIYEGISKDSKFYFSGNYCPRSYMSLTDWQNVDLEVDLKEQSTSPIDLKDYTIIEKNIIDYLLNNVGSWNKDEYDKAVLDSVRVKADWGGVSRFKFTMTEKRSFHLDVPEDPHEDDNNNGYTKLEEWVNGLRNEFLPDQSNHSPFIQGETVFTKGDIHERDVLHVVSIEGDSYDKTYSLLISDGNEEGIFGLDPASGAIFLQNSMALMQNGHYNLTVCLWNGTKNQCTDTALVKIIVSPFTTNLVNVYPNPSDGRFYVDIKGPEGQARMDITGMDGSTILSKNIYTPVNQLIDISNYPKGFYLLSFIQNNSTSTYKVLCQ